MGILLFIEYGDKRSGRIYRDFVSFADANSPPSFVGQDLNLVCLECVGVNLY